MASGSKKQPPPPPANPSIQLVNNPTAYEKIAEERMKRFTDWEKSGPRDILTAPGIGDIVDIYGNAENAAMANRMGNPMKALSGQGSGDYANQLEALGRGERYNQRAAGLSRGLQGLKAEAYGLGGSAADLESQRKQNYASLMLNQENAYYNRPKKPSLWERIAGLAIGGLAAI